MRMRWVPLPLALAIACGSRTAAPPVIREDAGAPGPSLSAAPRDAAPPAPATATTWKVARGDTLAPIANKIYGSRHYAAVISAVNRVTAERLAIGQVLTLPALDTIVNGAASAAAAPRLAAGVAGWLGARALAWDARRHDRPIAAGAQAAIRRAAADLRAGAHALPPGAAATAFTRAADAADVVADGSDPAEGYDVDGVDRRLAEGIAALARRTARP